MIVLAIVPSARVAPGQTVYLSMIVNTSLLISVEILLCQNEYDMLLGHEFLTSFAGLLYVVTVQGRPKISVMAHYCSPSTQPTPGCRFFTLTDGFDGHAAAPLPSLACNKIW